MKVPVSWLDKHVKINDLDIKFLEERLIMSGSNTEGIKDYADGISKVVIGHVLEQIKHPDADTLFVLQVDVGDEVVQIVTGAPNVSIGDYVPVALVGAWLYGGVKIKRGKLRGLISNGMLCSLDELGFERSVIPKAFDNGIYILQGEYTVGDNFYDVVNLGDKVIEFEITPNRPDCLSIEGMAREAKATFNRERKVMNDCNEFEMGHVKDFIDVEVLAPDICPRYAGFVIQDVNIEPSPQWMQIHLMLAGVRPINNIVDVTNYVMLELGQPIHPFDLDLVDEKKIFVRRADEGEKMKTLDSVERTFTNDDLVIASAKKAIGIAGIMGGENTEITDNTKNIFVEVANFNKTALRLTSKRIGLRTEASSRYEKGVDPNTVGKAINRLLELYQSMNVGVIVEGVLDIYPEVKKPTEVAITVKEVKRILGIDLTTDEIKDLLTKLEFSVVSQDDQSLLFTIPTFRLDIEKEIDLVEEVARMYGYDNIPITLPSTTLFGELNYRQKIEKKIRDILVASELYEISTYSFVSPTAINKINREDDQKINQFVRLINPLGEEYSVMRTTLLPNMLEVMARNYNNGNVNMSTFELGNTFIPKSLPITELPIEKKSLCMGAYGEKADFFIVKGLVELIMKQVGITDYSFVKSNEVKSHHPGRTAEIFIGTEHVGIIGEIHPKVLENYSIDVKTVTAELDFEMLVECSNLENRYSPVPKYPSIQRDIAILVKESVTNQQIVDIILANGGKNLVSVKLFDVYRGVQILAGHKSVAYNLIFRSDKKTLTDEEVQKPYDKIIRVLENELDASRR